MCANFAYRTLTYQGIPSENIRYLSSDTGLDLDNNNVPDVFGKPTNKALKESITTWTKGAKTLILYLTDHGEESLSGDALSGMLDSHQLSREGSADVLVLYDACLSGSLLPLLQAPEDKKRMLLASTTDEQNACFVLKGIVSFSQFFWTQVLNGANVRDAFMEASDAITRASGLLRQRPQLDDNGNGISNESTEGQVARLFRIGSGIVSAGEAPVICEDCLDLRNNSGDLATIHVEKITTTREIAKVWALVIPPDYTPRSAEDPVTDLPALDLAARGGGIYEGTCRGFTGTGDYEISVYAVDSEGNVSLPQQIAVSR